jgi:phosphomannomutase
VNTENQPPDPDRYRCPDQQHPISRAVHLGRLAAFYPACRQCAHRDDTGTLSPRQVKHLAETNQRGRPLSLFHDEGAGGVYLNDLTPAAAHDMAAAFGVMLRSEGSPDQTARLDTPGPHPSSFILP